MFCSSCGVETISGAAFCTTCGAPIAAGVEPPQTLKRPGIITLLAVLQLIGAAVWLVVGVGCIVAVAVSPAGDRITGVLIAVLFGGLGLLQLACGIGLWELKGYGRALQLGFAAVGLLGIPFGTIISICILIYLCKPGVRALFSGRHVQDFTPAELVEIASVTKGSQVTIVLLVALIALGSIAVIGIIAAIAVPGLLRARMSGNEASAIGSLRSINSAETSYAASAGKGGYAIRLATLSSPCPGSSQGFISPALSQDPSVNSGFTISLESAGADVGPNDCNAVPTESNYYATAVPVTMGTTGSRGFATSRAGTIFFEPGAAPTRSATLAGTASPIQ
jgi:type II secretory pathway pseudopilin PulG